MNNNINFLKNKLEEIKCEALSYDRYCYEIKVEDVEAIEDLLLELEKKDKIIFETKKYLENMTKSSIRDKDGYYLGNWYVLQPYELEDVIDILKGKENDE